MKKKMHFFSFYTGEAILALFNERMKKKSFSGIFVAVILNASDFEELMTVLLTKKINNIARNGCFSDKCALQ